MNLEEMVRYLRISILDDTGGYGIDWENIEEDSDEVAMLRWSNEELTLFINEAIRKVHRSIYDLKDHQSALDTSILATDTDATYDLDPRIIKIVKARKASDSLEIERAEIDDLWYVKDWETTTGKVDYYIPDYNSSKVTFYKKSLIDDTIEYIAYREELTPLSWYDNPGASPELAERFQIPAMNYVAYLAYLKDEANALDPQRAPMFLQAFINEFDNNSAYTETRRFRTRNKTIKYGGI